MHKIVSFCIAFDATNLHTISKTPKLIDIFYIKKHFF